MAELVDARDLKSLGIISRAGSSPAPGTITTKAFSRFHPLINLPKKQAVCNSCVIVPGKIGGYLGLKRRKVI